MRKCLLFLYKKIIHSMLCIFLPHLHYPMERSKKARFDYEYEKSAKNRKTFWNAG